MEVKVIGSQVQFTIGNQTFKLESCNEDTEEQSIEAANWMARQLQLAFNNLKEQLTKDKTEKNYVVFAEEPEAMMQEALIQQSNKLTLDEARKFAVRSNGYSYIYQYIEQVKPITE